MNNEEIVALLNTQFPAAVRTLNGEAIQFDLQRKFLVMTFRAGLDFCHSENVVQGGYITAMLDAVMAFSAIGVPGLCKMVATLEIKTSFMKASHDGDFRGEGRVIHAGRSIAYLSGDLYQSDELVASATSTVKLLT